MLTLWSSGEHKGFCDGMSRRSFLKIGGLVAGGLSLPGLLEAEAVAAANAGGGRARAVVPQVGDHGVSPGRAAHQDTFDLKPDAPAGIRGEFKPIATCLPGVQVCERRPAAITGCA